MSLSSKIKHDLINNGLRIEVLNKMISENLEQDKTCDQDQLEDMQSFLLQHLELIKAYQNNLS